MTAEYLVLDIETTGINFIADRVLEIGAIALDENMQPIAEFERLVYGNMIELRKYADDFVKEMHTKSGLWDALSARTMPYTLSTMDVQNDFITFLQSVGFEKGKVCIAGNSIAMFDIPMMKAQMPAVADWFSHRTYDFSGSYRYITKMAKVVGMPHEEQALTHRALQDCRDELAWSNKMIDTLRQAFVALDKQKQDEALVENLIQKAIRGEWDANGGPVELPETD